MIDLAMRAELPLISVETTDTLNVREILTHLIEAPVQDITGQKEVPPTGKYFMTTYSIEGAIEELYSALVDNEQVLVMVNSELESQLIFKAGALPTPKALIRRHLDPILEEKDIDRLMPSLGGLTLKEVAEVARLAMAQYGCLDYHGVMQIRRLITGQHRGLQQVDTDMPFYITPGFLKEWIDTNRYFFLECMEPRLVPRGLLLDGPPGVGKTQGAKALANELGVPLYLLNLGSMLGKYVGESEGNLRMALQQVDREEPCIVLMDEIEKIFSGGDDSGVTTRLLSQLLWWLQEHKSRVLTIMTTNDMAGLPPELYRPGRIDEVLSFQGLTYKEALPFTHSLLDTLNIQADKVELGKLNNETLSLYQEEAKQLKKGYDMVTVSHAKVTTRVYGWLKKVLTKP